MQHGNTALALVREDHDEVVGVLIGAGMAAGQWPDVNAFVTYVYPSTHTHIHADDQAVV